MAKSRLSTMAINSAENQLWRIYDHLADSIEEASADEIRDEIVEDGEDPEFLAARTKNIMVAIVAEYRKKEVTS